jgi:hypothetical protein
MIRSLGLGSKTNPAFVKLFRQGFFYAKLFSQAMGAVLDIEH